MPQLQVTIVVTTRQTTGRGYSSYDQDKEHIAKLIAGVSEAINVSSFTVDHSNSTAVIEGTTPSDVSQLALALYSNTNVAPYITKLHTVQLQNDYYKDTEPQTLSQQDAPSKKQCTCDVSVDYCVVHSA